MRPCLGYSKFEGFLFFLLREEFKSLKIINSSKSLKSKKLVERTIGLVFGIGKYQLHWKRSEGNGIATYNVRGGTLRRNDRVRDKRVEEIKLEWL